MAWAGLVIYKGQQLPEGFLTYTQIVAGLLPSLILVFDRYLWRLPIFNLLAASRPDLQGTWKGVIQSKWKDANGQTPPPIEAYFVVRQTYSTVHLKLLTRESESDTSTANIKEEENGTSTVHAVYRATPKQQFQEKSKTHHGSFLLKIIGPAPFRSSGEYWTDRDSKGEFQFSARSKVLCDDFESAARLTWTEQPSPQNSPNA